MNYVLSEAEQREVRICQAVIDALIEKMGLQQINDVAVLQKIIDEVTARIEVDKPVNFLLGKVMKASNDRANPVLVKELLQRNRPAA